MKTDRRIGGGAFAPHRRCPLNHRHPLIAAIRLFLQPLAACVDPAKRRVHWTPLAASTAAVLMALAEGALGGRFRATHRCLAADYRRRRRTGATYNGLLKALARQQHTVLPRVKAEPRAHVRQRLQRIDPAGRWVLLAVDGSKEGLPRTRAHEVGFGIADNGRFPQAFVTAVVEVYTGLLWDWRLGPAPLPAAVRESLRRDLGARGHTHEALGRALGRCLKDTYQRRRSKQSRHRFATVNTPTKHLQPPMVRPATAQDQADAQKYARRTAA
ncbi:MAG: hypothetical protein HOP29_04850 [Phycisphaerales bacterium]|nr:hypothetical protein [Phycisphaerales bacterium]